MFTVASYNILHGYRHKQILDNLELLVEKGADIICLQEADKTFVPFLKQWLKQPSRRKWQFADIHLSLGCNLATLWNTESFSKLGEYIVELPRPGQSDRQRGALAIEFSTKDKTIRVTNTHLSWEGGTKHKFQQLRHLEHCLEKYPVENEIICGDFNTFRPATLRSRQKRLVETTLGSGWANALPDLVWTCDISDSYPGDLFHWISASLRFLGFQLRTCLDYIMIKTLKVFSGEMLDLPGSDHRPIMCVIE